MKFANLFYNLPAFVIWSLATVFVISTNIFFGLNLFPKSSAELICDGIGLAMIALCIVCIKRPHLVVTIQRKEQNDVEEILEYIENTETTVLKADGFDNAIIGHTSYWNGIPNTILVYDAEKCIEILMERDGMDYEEASEFFSFNVAGSWNGDGTPLFVYKY